ncbi:MAG: hypothetical protein AB1806_17290 [Acidobacteriota bacterium]
MGTGITNTTTTITTTRSASVSELEPPTWRTMGRRRAVRERSQIIPNHALQPTVAGVVVSARG